MKVRRHKVRVAELVEGYCDDTKTGGSIVGYGGALDIRPPYQRNFVYNMQQARAVIDTVLKGHPLNVMYWSDSGDGKFEIIDGQQRTISIAEYVASRRFALEGLYFFNQHAEDQARILDYDLLVYVCTGTDKERLAWFETVNTAGERLYPQERRNAVYSGAWVSDAKLYFSKSGCPAYEIGKRFVKGKPIRQEFLETAIRWASDDNIVDYMARHQHDARAEHLWDHFRAVIEWIPQVFTTYREEMKGVDWGILHRAYKDLKADTGAIEDETQRLIDDEDVTNPSGIYPYILTRNERHLNIRKFSRQVKRRVYEKQGKKCAECREPCQFAESEADHVTPWSAGGKTIEANCQVLCKSCNRRKGSR